MTKLKTPDEIEADKRAAGGKETVEASKMATTEMAENAGEDPAKVRIFNQIEMLNCCEIRSIKTDSMSSRVLVKCDRVSLRQIKATRMLNLEITHMRVTRVII